MSVMWEVFSKKWLATNIEREHQSSVLENLLTTTIMKLFFPRNETMSITLVLQHMKTTLMLLLAQGTFPRLDASSKYLKQ